MPNDYRTSCEEAASHLHLDIQQNISDYFATPGTDRSFTSGFYSKESERTPELKDKLAVLECSFFSRHPGGDHTVLLGEVVSARIVDPDAKPLIYLKGEYATVSS